MRKAINGNVEPNWLDRWLLRGSNPYESCTKLAMLRLRGMIILALAIAIVGISLMLWSFQLQNDRVADQAKREREKLIASCEQRNAQGVRSKTLLMRFAEGEEVENVKIRAEYLRLSRLATDPERRRFLVLLGELELQRDVATAKLFRELADNVKPTDCEAEASGR